LTLGLNTKGQVRTDTLNVLELIKEPRYLEFNNFTRQTKLTLKQSVLFDDTTTIDEERWHILTITFNDFNLFKSKSLFYLEQDSSLLKCEYLYGGNEFIGRTSDKQIVGQIRVVSSSSQSVELELNIFVTTLKNNICCYKGRREFILNSDFHQ
jgi:hypothetical protein